MLRVKAEGDRVEVTTATGLGARVVGGVLVAAGLVAVGWLARGLGRTETRHFTCERASESCAVQIGDDVGLLKLATIRLATVIEHPVGARLIVVLADESNRTLGRDTTHPASTVEYKQAAHAINGFLTGDAPSLKVGYVWRPGWLDHVPPLAASVLGLLSGLWLLARGHRRHVLLDKGAGTVTWTSSGPLRWTRQRRVRFAEVKGVARGGRGAVRKLDLVLASGKKVRLLAGPADGVEAAEKALAAALPAAPAAAGLIPRAK